MGFLRTSVLVILPLAAATIDSPPPTRIEPVTETLHGVTLTDPYRWLENQTSPETRAWIEAQSAYADRYLSGLAGRDAVRRKIEPMLRIDNYGSPVVRGGKYYFMRQLAREDRASICVRQGPSGAERVVVRPEDVSADPSVSIGLGEVSDDGALMTYSVRQGGEDEVELRFLDLAAGKLLPDRLPRARYFGLALRPDGKGIYYSQLRKEGTRVYYHELGKPAESDRFLFGKGTGLVPADGVSISEDGRWLILRLFYGTSSRTEVRLKDLARDGEILDVVTGIDAQFRPAVHAGKLYLWTNWKAPNWRLLAVDLTDPRLEKAAEIIPERETVLSSLSFGGGRIWASYLENVEPRIYQFDPAGKPLGEFARPGVGTTGVPFGEWRSAELFYRFSSFAVPATIYRLDVRTGKSTIWHRNRVPVKTADIETRQVWYTSRDGTKVPMWLVHRKGLKPDGDRPVFLTGYGGFNISQLANFDANAVLWASLGGVFAKPCLRGGGEFGERWHQAAMFDRKQNTFDDFIAAAEYLIANRYTNSRRIAISGGSNGGLLVGALMTQRPELVGAVHCGIPLLDMVRFHKFLLGRFWVSEYGNPEKPEAFRYILRYSPYHRVEKGAKYPAVIFTTGDSDTRVDPLHARKMTALLQASTASGRPVILKYDTKAGHSGGKPRTQLIEDAVDVQLFLLHAVGASTAWSK